MTGATVRGQFLIASKKGNQVFLSEQRTWKRKFQETMLRIGKKIRLKVRVRTQGKNLLCLAHRRSTIISFRFPIPERKKSFMTNKQGRNFLSGRFTSWVCTFVGGN